MSGGRVPLLQQHGLLLHVPHAPGVRRLALAAALVLGTAVLGIAALLRRRAEPRHVLVIDAGSSGTRMYAYTWQEGGDDGMPLVVALPASAAPRRVPRRAVPGKRAYQRVETEPGLDRFVGDATGLQAKALGPLLDWAKAVVPSRLWKHTPVFLFGTAGLRKLSAAQQQGLLDDVIGALHQSPFRFHPAWSRIISGIDEGVYGWVALNYLKGTLRRTVSSAETLGALDLGGSSLEITFATESVPKQEDAVNVSLLGASHQLYAHAHHHYGLNDAFDRSVSILLAAAASSDIHGASGFHGAAERAAVIAAAEQGEAHTAGRHRLHAALALPPGQPQQLAVDLKAWPEVRHPCLHEGYRQRYSRLRQDGALPNPPSVTLVGSSRYAACQRLALAVVNASVPCSAAQCALGTPQPSAAGRRFVALSGFFVVFKFFRLPPHASMDALEEAGRSFCAMTWADAQLERSGELMLENYCFRAPYVSALVRQGLLLKDGQLEIGGGEVGWTLGAALAEGYRLAGLGVAGSQSAVLRWRWPLLFERHRLLQLVASIAFVVLLFAVVLQQLSAGGIASARRGGFNKLVAKSSAELMDLSVCTPTLAGLIYVPPPSSRSSTPPGSSRSTGVWWAATPVVLQPGGTTAVDASGSALTARGRSQSWAALGAAGGGGGSGTGSGLPVSAAQQEAVYASNLNLLGRTRTFSRRSLNTSPEGGE